MRTQIVLFLALLLSATVWAFTLVNKISIHSSRCHVWTASPHANEWTESTSRHSITFNGSSVDDEQPHENNNPASFISRLVITLEKNLAKLGVTTETHKDLLVSIEGIALLINQSIWAPHQEITILCNMRLM
jgi:hypothetical protein